MKIIKTIWPDFNHVISMLKSKGLLSEGYFMDQLALEQADEMKIAKNLGKMDSVPTDAIPPPMNVEPIIFSSSV